MLPDMLKPWVLLVMLGGVANGGPTARFGLTGAFTDQSSPDSAQFGPQVALGERFGAFVGEVDYAYLSFFGANIDHRIGLTLRADLNHSASNRCILGYACTRGSTFFGEAGIAERYGHTPIDAQHPDPIAKNKPEIHLGLGLELENQLVPHRNGWQFGLRLAITPSDHVLGTACRGAACAMTTVTTTRAVDAAVLFEWMYVLGN